MKKQHTWQDAVARWMIEMAYKKSIVHDASIFCWLESYIKNYSLNGFSSLTINMLIEFKNKENVKPATVNRMLALIKSVLNKAHKEWGWIDKVPYIKMKKENNSRVRWLSKEETVRLFQELPAHLVPLVEFSLATGQRADNVRGLKWADIDIKHNLWCIKAEHFKNGKQHYVALNKAALNVLELCAHNQSEYVFLYKGENIKKCNTPAFRKALKRAGIKDFCWHDIRHTWASRHVQNGTSLQELQQLGGWENFDMVLRYSHLDPKQLQKAANNICKE